MSDYIIRNNELYHYGVLGMKWGVRRNPSKAYAKASKKLDKLDKKVEYRRAAARKARSRADNKEASWLASDRSVYKANKKAKKAQRKAIVSVGKARNWYLNMEKEFAKTDISLTKDQVDLGQKYLNTLNLHTELRSVL